ncbi:hypothetical protein FOZG_14469 [Fusarium oxysporum Fo47]|uniref:Uncharacterized protein n=1 Tax=Fusarium oxysporum Fo47 TaxID=660027 RepID=W9JR34_FUSOX|nr:hypothetical protein FOZG_14469 [Fusarium oxysporum Fo47]
MAAVNSDLPCASGSETINSLYLTYKAAQQITETLWANERDEELRSFCASLMAYFNMMKRSLSILDDTSVSDGDNSLITLLLAPIKLMFPATCFKGPAKDRLRELVRLGENIGRAKSDFTNLTNIALVDLTKTYESRDELLKSLAMCEETLRDSYLEDLSRWATEDFSPQLVIAELPYGISNAAQSMFEAMVACIDCRCKTEHDFGARLYLGTHRKPEATPRAEDEDIIDFDMFLSTQYDWKEVRVHVSRNRVVQIVTGPANDSQSKRKRTEANALKIRQLCEAIAKIKSMAAYRLELKVLRNQLFQLQPEICNSAIDTSQNAVSLEYILRHRKGSFTERTKRILAVILASTVFHLYDTPWLQSTWGSPDILFFRTSSSAILFRPFINTPLSSLHPPVAEAPTNPPSSDDIPKDTDSDDPDLEDFFTHPCPNVITLALVLLEVYLETPLDILAQKFNIKLGTNTQPSAFTRYMDANLGSTSLDHPHSSPVPDYPADGPSNRSNLSDPRLDMQDYPHSAYTVGIICALPLELRAVQALFDTEHNGHTKMKGDSNTYALGTMGQHMIVAACLPSGEYGTNAAADAASNMRRTYYELEFCLLVGIGGGTPSPEIDIRLGDVVVSLPTSRSSGVIQYDRGKECEGNTFQLTGSLQGPPKGLRTATSALCSKPDHCSNSLRPYLEDIVRSIPCSPTSDYSHPGQENDHLFKAACSTCFALRDCIDAESHVQRRARRPTDQPEVHYGLIASGNRVLKDAVARDRWAKEHGILCFEMEAAGVMNTLPCLVIRGICDYADSYKNKRWQNYAAATAASYAKLLLRHTASSSIEWNTARIGYKNSLCIYTNGEEPKAKR